MIYIFERFKSTTGSSKKGSGFKQPDGAYRYWHTDISYVKIREVFYYLITVLYGHSRSIVAWDIRESMTTGDVQIVIENASEAHPAAKPRRAATTWPWSTPCRPASRR